MIKYIYDVEVFCDFFSATFIPLEGDEVIQFHSRDKNISELRNFIKGKYLIGYNNSRYDDIILNTIYKGQVTCTDLYKLSQELITCEYTQFYVKFREYLRDIPFKSLDLMRILAFDKLMIGLKQCSVNLQHDKIQDLPKKYDDTVQDEEVGEILRYNLNDCIITRKLYHKVHDQIKMREDLENVEIRVKEKLSSLYGEDFSNCSDTAIGKKILTKCYGDEAKNRRTPRTIIELKDCIADTVEFKTQYGKLFLEDLKNTTIRKTKGELNFAPKFAGVEFKMGTGGLHSVDSPEWFKSNPDEFLIDCDVSSMYPSIMLKYKIKPEHLEDKFFDTLSTLTKERLDAKKKDKVKADALKITINSIYGLLISDKFWLYDPKAGMSVTINGQLFLLMLIEAFQEAGITVLSANTDGVVCIISKQNEQIYYEICSEWEQRVGLQLEYTHYNQYIRRDVNNYIAETTDGKLKHKGCFITEIQLQKGYSMPIVAEALENYFIRGIPVLDILKNETDILKFCKSQKMSSDFVANLEYIEGSELKRKELQKTNRYYVSKKGGALIKVRKEIKLNKNGKALAEVTNVEKDRLVTILNDLDDTDHIANVDFNYYKQECHKIIDQIYMEGSQTLF